MVRKCRIDGGELVEVFDLGNLYVSDFVDLPNQGERSPLRLGLCRDCGLVQLYDSYPPTKMYENYWYLSGVNESMRAALADITSCAQRFVRLKRGDVVLDIGANDGTLLKTYPDDCIKVGVDPAKSLAHLLSQVANYVVSDYFTADAFLKLSLPPAKVITSIAMFYDLDDPIRFARDIRGCLARDGVWVCQLSYTPFMLRLNAFDNICSEHVTYYTLATFMRVTNEVGLRIVDVELNNVNAGSFRVYCMREDAEYQDFNCNYDIGNFRTESLLMTEERMRLRDPSVYKEFEKRVHSLREETVTLLRDLNKQGKTVAGYGASTKGNTLLQYYGIGPDLLPYIAERSPAKFGKYTVGSYIPIVSEREMRSRKPDYLFVLPYHFIDGILERERLFIESGGKFIVPLPRLRIIG